MKTKEVVVLSRETMLRAQAEIGRCEACSEGADIIFDLILDQVTGRDPSTTDYFLSELSMCPECGTPVLEDTLVEPAGMEKADWITPSFSELIQRAVCDRSILLLRNRGGQ